MPETYSGAVLRGHNTYYENATQQNNNRVNKAQKLIDLRLICHNWTRPRTRSGRR